MIAFSGKPSDSLVWDVKPFHEGDSFFVRLDLGLEESYFPIDDEMHFQALSLACAQFTQEIWSHYKEKIKGLILYSGSADFSRTFNWTEKQKQNWESWIQGRADLPEKHLRRLFCLETFAYYFQMLSYRLPDEMPLFLQLDLTAISSLAERHHLLSRERFEHFQVASRGLAPTYGWVWTEVGLERPSLPPSAFCFPLDKECTKEILERADRKMGSFTEPFRVVYESFLTEEWDEVSDLYILDGTMSPQGKRKLKGFEAAGGRIKFGAEGFEPPAYWSQTSRASQTALCPD